MGRVARLHGGGFLTVLRSQRRMQEWQHDEAAADDQEVADVDRRYRQARRVFDSNGRLLQLSQRRVNVESLS